MSITAVADAGGGGALRPVAAMSGVEQMAETVALARLIAQSQARQLELIAALHSSGVCETATGLGTVSWLAVETGISRRAAAAQVALAVSLRDQLPQVGALLAAGEISPQVAHTASTTVRDVLKDTPNTTLADIAARDAVLASVDTSLALLAANLTADDFAHDARKIQTYVTTEAGERSHARQHQARRLSHSTLMDGSWKTDGAFDTEAGAIIDTALDPLCRPAGPDDARTPPQRRADALVEICSHFLNGGGPPQRGTVKPHLTILTPLNLALDTKPITPMNDGDSGGYDSGGDHDGGDGCAGSNRGQNGPTEPSPPIGPTRPKVDLPTALARLRAKNGVAEIIGAGPIPRSVLDRLACDACLRRVVIDADSMPLDVGRAHRLVTSAQRTALTIRDRGCAYPGCHRPATWTDAHHIVHWIHGGPTNLDNLILLCRHHHTGAHDGRYHLTIEATHVIFTHKHGHEIGRHRMTAGP